MSFKLTKNISARISTDDGYSIGSQDVSLSITYSIISITLSDDSNGIAQLGAQINNGSIFPVSSYPFIYDISKGSVFEQAQSIIMALTEFGGSSVD
jgi:hypothetical protein